MYLNKWICRLDLPFVFIFFRERELIFENSLRQKVTNKNSQKTFKKSHIQSLVTHDVIRSLLNVF